MLIAFFKSHKDEKCQCYIEKFVDRLWLYRSGAMICIRTFIVHVLESSPVPLTKIRLLVPFQEVMDLKDLNGTCLEKDYLFNTFSFSTGGYQTKTYEPDKKLGYIKYDFFEKVKVDTNCNLTKYPPKDAELSTVIALECDKSPILRGEYRIFRYAFKVNDQLINFFDESTRVYGFETSYFNNRPYQEAYKGLNILKLEIPALKLVNEVTMQGGFDIFLYLPDALVGTKFNETTETSATHLPDGKRSENRFQKIIWRARHLIENDTLELRAGKTVFKLHGLLNDPYQLEGIRQDVCNMQNDVARLKQDSKRGMKLTILALIVAIFGFLGLFKEHIVDFFNYCISGDGATISESQEGRTVSPTNSDK